MARETFHVPDQELLAAADGELSGRRMKQVRQHLETCWQCRARQREIESTIVDFVQAHQQQFDARIPGPDGARALLQGRMRQASAAHLGALWDLSAGWRQLFTGNRLAIAIAAAIAVLGFAVVKTLRSDRGMTESRAAAGISAPDPRITPGAALPLTRAEVCATERMDRSPAVPRAVALKVFEDYGIVDPSPRSYELDYLITPELGGSDDVRNLWPQPYQAASWDAHAKDALEDHLHQLVCGGGLDLETAQRDIAVDWIAAYKKYFRTDQPLSMHASFLKDRPFE